MKPGEPIDARVPWIRALHALDEAWQVGTSGARQRAVEQAGKRVGDALREGPRVISVRTLPTSLAPYPVRFAFNGATPGGLLMIQNRSLLIQVRAGGELKNILFNPTDGPANQRTPFYARLTERTPEI